jgi:hypothetical protein
MSKNQERHRQRSHEGRPKHWASPLIVKAIEHEMDSLKSRDTNIGRRGLRLLKGVEFALAAAKNLPYSIICLDLK